MRHLLVFAVVAAGAILFRSEPVQAVESYPAAISEQFMSWCTRSQDQPQTVCSCALNKAVVEIPVTAMSSFLVSAEGGGVAATTTGVGVTALQIVTTCAVAGGDTGSTGGSMLKGLGSSLGQ